MAVPRECQERRGGRLPGKPADCESSGPASSSRARVPGRWRGQPSSCEARQPQATEAPEPGSMAGIKEKFHTYRPSSELCLKNSFSGSSHHGSAVMNPTSIQEDSRMRTQSLALLSELRIQHCGELWCRSQTRLGSCVAVAVT